MISHYDGVAEELAELRHTIDNLDAAIVHLLAERFRCTKTIGALKARHDMASQDPRREAAQVMRMRDLAARSKLDPEFAQKFHAFVVREVIDNHEAMRTK
jgi:chorismate mutase